ncbi:hypothetical protein [Pseudoalteromonas xiamenensis]
MSYVQVQLTGVAMVTLSRTVALPAHQAKAILADDDAIQTLLSNSKQIAVMQWNCVGGQREAVTLPVSHGYQCLAVRCGWVGTEDDKKITENGATCPRCSGAKFHEVQSIQPR